MKSPPVAVMAVGGLAVGASILVGRRFFRSQAIEHIPAKMKQIRLAEPNDDMAKAVVSLDEVDVPKPRPGQVLIKVAAAPVNPSDYGFLRTKAHGVTYPCKLGNEGSGTVVATGGGMFGRWLLGKKVAFVCSGTYAQYCVAPASMVFPLPTDMPVEDGCSFFVNPWTAIAIVETAKKHGKCLVNTAAASALGKMLVRLCAKEGLTLVNVVRSQDQAQTLQALGAKHVLISPGYIAGGAPGEEEKEFASSLKAKMKEFKCSVAFDAVGGFMSGLLVTCLPSSGTLYVYGRLSPDGVGGIDPLDLIYRKKQVKGLLLTSYMKSLGMLKVLQTARRVNALLKSDMSTKFKDYPLQDMMSSIRDLAQGKTVTNAKPRLLVQ